MDGRLLRFLGRSGKRAAGGLELRLIPAAALLQARSEAEHLAQGDAQAFGLCLNACILARAALTGTDGRRFKAARMYLRGFRRRRSRA